MNSQRNTDNGVTLAAELFERSRLTDGVPLQFSIRNEGKTSVSIGDTGYAPDCLISVADTNTGQEIQRTTFGANTVGGPDVQRQGYAHVTLSPGEVREWRVDLAECFILSRGNLRASIVVYLKSKRPVGAVRGSCRRFGI